MILLIWMAKSITSIDKFISGLVTLLVGDDFSLICNRHEVLARKLL